MLDVREMSLRIYDAIVWNDIPIHKTHAIYVNVLKQMLKTLMACKTAILNPLRHGAFLLDFIPSIDK